MARGKILREVAGAAVDELVNIGRMKLQDRGALVDRVASGLQNQPEVVNATNSEPKIQSRVVVGLATAIAGAVLNSVDWGETENWILQNMPLIIEALGFAIAGIGRLVKGLKPINWRKPWTLFGIFAKE